MQKAKINLQEVRNFGDSITATFLFIKQEFKSLVRSFVVIMLPLIFVDLFVKSHMIKTMFTFVVAQAKDGILSIFLGYLSSMLVFYWLILFVNSFLRVYADKFRNSSEEGVLVKAGPLRNSNFPTFGINTEVPNTSLGIKSGVNCKRQNRTSTN